LLNNQVSLFLFKYRLTPHSSTGVSPAEQIFGRKLRSQLDLVKPDAGQKARQEQDRQRKSHDAHAKPRSFVVGETVYTRNYAQGTRWLPGTMVEIEGQVLVHVKLTDGRILRRHVDQVRPRTATDGDSPPASDEGSEDGPPPCGNDTVQKSLNQLHPKQQKLLKPRSQTSNQQPRSLTSQQQRNPIRMLNELNQKLRLSRIRLIPHRLSGDLAGQVTHLKGLMNGDFSLGFGFCVISYGYG
jgi:hypothetical protein